MTRPLPKPVAIKPVVNAHAQGPLLPHDHLEWVEAWGMESRSMAHVFRPSTAEGIAAVFDIARQTGRTAAFKGGGCSYGDAFQNREEVVLDLSRMNRILEWNPEDGVVTVEPGVRVADLWRYIVGDGYWPPVVSGTMFTTMGGCAAMNIHGKNAYRVGPFGNHITGFEMLLPTGETVSVTRASDPDLFRGAISGLGMLGAFTRITLKMKRIHSGYLRVTARPARDFHEMVELFEENESQCDYMVGWADCFSRRSIGRGEMHFAAHLPPGEDLNPAQTLRVENQELPDRLFGLLPKSILWRFMKPFVNNPGMRLINAAKCAAQKKPGAGKPYLQSHAAFHFLLDYVPDWKLSYRPKALIQYQSFVPADQAPRVFTEQIRLSQRRGIIPYLAVTKKHVPDDYLITHGVAGYSLALDYPVTDKNRGRLWELCHEMDELVLAAGGRFYLAKDCTMRQGTPARYLPAENLRAFAALKQRCDPENLLSTDLSRRVFGSLLHPGAARKAGNSTSRPVQFIQPA